MEPSQDRELLLEMYRRMFLIRRFDERVAELHSAGQIAGGVHLTIGQEAAVVGACLALRPDDYMTGTHRSHGHPLAKGARPHPLMAELLGRRTGVNKGKGGSMHLADFSIGSLGETSIVGSGLPIATGGALSAKMRRSGQVALCFFGDGAANEGAFHESLNLAALWSLPVIFFCENNRYALSTSVRSSCSIENIADRAVAYGIPGSVVDGQDPIASYVAVAGAAERARSGAGPTLIEAKTYRYNEHAQGLRLSYRSEDEIQGWRARDPIPSLRRKLIDLGTLEVEIERIELLVEKTIEEAVEFAVSSEFPAYEEAFQDLFAGEGAS